jgi:ATP-dependent Zn protease
MKTIVIVGGGYGGVALAKALEKQHHSDDSVRILLIEAKSHFYHTVGGLRAAVQDLDDVVFIPYANVFTSSRHQVVHATVNRFDKKAVYLDSVTQDGGDQIAYDFLVSSLIFFFFFFLLFLFSHSMQGHCHRNELRRTSKNRMRRIGSRQATITTDSTTDQASSPCAHYRRRARGH